MRENVLDDHGFYDAMLKGNIFKDIAKLLLEKSGYTVYPYGYESTFSHVKSNGWTLKRQTVHISTTESGNNHIWLPIDSQC